MSVDIVRNILKKTTHAQTGTPFLEYDHKHRPTTKKTTNKSCMHINTLHAYPRINYVPGLFALCLCFFYCTVHRILGLGKV